MTALVDQWIERFAFATEESREIVRKAVVEFSAEFGVELDAAKITEPWDVGYLSVGTDDEEELQLTLAEIAQATGHPLIESTPATDMNETMRLGKASLLYARYAGWEGRLDLRPGSMGRMLLSSYTGVDT